MAGESGKQNTYILFNYILFYGFSFFTFNGLWLKFFCNIFVIILIYTNMTGKLDLELTIRIGNLIL